MTYHTGNRFLTRAEMEDNANYIWAYLSARGWTKNAVAAMLGNMETESTINPGIWQNLDEGNTALGYGLVQWTPATKYLNWCADRKLDDEAMASALQRIEYERANGLQWIATNEFPMSFDEFKTSTAAPATLARAFLINYERPADQDQPARGTQAESWFSFLGDGSEPTPGGGSWKPSKKKMPLWLILEAARRR